jgi:plasmid stability protein
MKKQARRRVRMGRSGQGVDAVGRIQYTVRNIPEHVDRALRRKAREGRKSLHEVLRDALTREAGVAEPSSRRYSDLDALAGTWIDDAGFDETIKVQDQVDESLWR